ncbi:MAG: DUF5696 domain-containing protein [Oscillospiraceae bacterium]|nr:DUF5696 domain-containing protein [Oscillospiraceae bacterium]
MLSLKRKILKHNKLIAWFVILSMFISLGSQVWSEQGESDGISEAVEGESGEANAEGAEDEEGEISNDLPRRDEAEMLAQMELFAETDELELFVLENYEYSGRVNEYADFYLYGKDGALVAFEEGMFDNIDNQIPIYDHNGEPVLGEDGEQRVESPGFFRRVELPFGEVPPVYEDVPDEEADADDEDEDEEADEEADADEDEDGESDEDSDEDEDGESDDADSDVDDESDEDEESNEDDTDELEESDEEEPTDTAQQRDYEADELVTRLVYTGIVAKRVDKVKEEGIFAVRVKANGYVWWSNPVNAVHDPFAKGAQVNSLSSPIEIVAGNPNTYSTRIIRSNTQKSDEGPSNYSFINACESIETIPGGARFRYHFPEAHTRLAMDVVLDGDSVLVTIPQSELVESLITTETGNSASPSVILNLSVLNSFGAAPSGEDGYIVVADGSGAVIEFDNGKSNSAPYSGQVYGRDYSVSQKLAPPITQQVYLPVYGIVRDKGENALVAIAEKGDENATIKATVSRQGSNATAFNLAWFDFRMRTVDSFYIGTGFEELTIYESFKIKTGDIAVRYYPLAGEGLSYVDVANAYSTHLQRDDLDNSAVVPKSGTDSMSFYMSLNGGTVKTHSIVGFPFNLQTAATTYSEAEEIVKTLKAKGVEDLVITYNDFSTPSIKREVTTAVRYSSMLGGKSDFNALINTVNQNSAVIYPSMGFMEFRKSGGGYSTMRHAPREVTRSRAVQQRYELAFGTPDPLQKVSAILSPFYFEKAFDKIIESLKAEGITSISLDNATTLLYSDFSRRNPFGEVYFNRRDTVQILTEGFKKLNDAGISILAQSANAYSLPYVSHISNVPLHSSNFDIFDYDVPFYQIVVSGLVPYSTTPFNASSNLNSLTLLAISSATPVHFEFIYENPGDFNDSGYNNKFYASYRDWLDDSIDAYKMFKDLVGDIAGERIVRHERLSVGEYETVFEGGKTIYINLASNELKIDGNTIDLNQYYERGGN